MNERIRARLEVVLISLAAVLLKLSTDIGPYRNLRRWPRDGR